MKYTKYLKPQQILDIEDELISQEAKIYIARSISPNGVDAPATAIRNMIINIARTCAGMPNIVLDTDDEYYEVPVTAWHLSEFVPAIRRLNTVELLEFLGDLVSHNNLEGLTGDFINEVFELENASFRIKVTEMFSGVIVHYEIIPLIDLEKSLQEDSHPNIRLLLQRIADGLKNQDPSAVLHASSNIFETLAKDIVSIVGVQDQTLASFFDRYRKDSGLPAPILDYILSIYKRRNSEPLAGHGSTKSPDITMQEALVLSEITKAFVSIEYRLKLRQVSQTA